MNEGRSHVGILGAWERGSQTKLRCLAFTLNLSGHALIPRGYLPRRSLYGMRLQLIKIPLFVRRFGWLMLDGVSESAENAGRAFPDLNVKEQIHDRCLYTY